METFLGCLLAFFIGLVVFTWVLFRQGLRFILKLLGINIPDAQYNAFQRAQQQAQRQARQQGASTSGAQQRQSSSQGGQQSHAQQSNSASHGRIFEKDDSEYVDFEDVP